jgi:hypothetical protein
LVLAFVLVAFADLGIESEGCLHTNEKTFDIKCFKHDFRNLLAIFGGVHGRLREDEPVVLGFAPEVLMNGLVPVLFNSFPVTYLTLA